MSEKLACQYVSPIDRVQKKRSAPSAVQLLLFTILAFLLMPLSFRWHEYCHLSAVVGCGMFSEIVQLKQELRSAEQLHSTDRWTICTPPLIVFFSICKIVALQFGFLTW